MMPREKSVNDPVDVATLAGLCVIFGALLWEIIQWVFVDPIVANVARALQ